MRSPLIAVLWLAPSLALAQTATSDDLLGPANPQAKGPPITYQSVFGKQPTRPAEAPWRASNDEVGRLGGHAGSLRESEETSPASLAGHETDGAANAAPSQRMHTHDHK